MYLEITRCKKFVLNNCMINSIYHFLSLITSPDDNKQMFAVSLNIIVGVILKLVSKMYIRYYYQNKPLKRRASCRFDKGFFLNLEAK